MLTCQTQCNERIELIRTIKEAERDKQISLFDTESKKYKDNTFCENRIANMFYYTLEQQDRTKLIAMNRKTTEIMTNLAIEHFGQNNTYICFLHTVFLHIVSAATTLNWNCKTLNSFLTALLQGNYSREETK